MKTILLISAQSPKGENFNESLQTAGYSLITASPQQLLKHPSDFPLPDAVILPYSWESDLALRGFQLSRKCACGQIPLVLIGNILPDYTSNQASVIGRFNDFPLPAQLIQLFKNCWPN